MISIIIVFFCPPSPGLLVFLSGGNISITARLTYRGKTGCCLFDARVFVNCHNLYTYNWLWQMIWSLACRLLFLLALALGCHLWPEIVKIFIYKTGGNPLCRNRWFLKMPPGSRWLRAWASWRGPW